MIQKSRHILIRQMSVNQFEISSKYMQKLYIKILSACVFFFTYNWYILYKNTHVKRDVTQANFFDIYLSFHQSSQ